MYQGKWKQNVTYVCVYKAYASVHRPTYTGYAYGPDAYKVYAYSLWSCIQQVPFLISEAISTELKPLVVLLNAPRQMTG